jgi:hypothetical protein
MTRWHGAGWAVDTEQKYAVLLEYTKASFKRVQQRLRHVWALAHVKRVLNDYALGSNLDRQFGNLPVGLRKILLNMNHEFTPRTCSWFILRRKWSAVGSMSDTGTRRKHGSKTYMKLNDSREPITAHAISAARPA